MADEDFKNEIGLIRKKGEQGLVGALEKFHHRRIKRLRIKLRKLEQAKSRKSNFVNKQTSNRQQPPASECKKPECLQTSHSNFSQD